MMKKKYDKKTVLLFLTENNNQIDNKSRKLIKNKQKLLILDSHDILTVVF